jgi:hypothetical protein
MLLERLPYLSTILRGNKARAPSASTTSTIRAIQKITAFHGTTVTGDGDGEDDLEQAPALDGEQWATDKPAEGEPRRRRVRIETKAKGEEAVAGITGIGEGTGLVLSEDDIED